MKNEMKKDHYTIGDISKMYGIGADSLRYYEEKGLLKPERTPSGYRIYRDTDIWRLNVIGELRSLDVSVDNIKKYLESGSAQSAINILNDELVSVREKIEQLHEIESRLINTIDNILSAQNIHLNTVTIQNFPERRAFCIKQRFSSDEDMDKIMKRLVDDYGKHNIIGNNHIAAILTPLFDHDSLYSGAYLISDDGTEVIPAGNYLSIFYSGKWNSRHYVNILSEYAQQNKLRLDTNFMDLVWLDIHTTNKVEEHISELQVRIRSKI